MLLCVYFVPKLLIILAPFCGKFMAGKILTINKVEFRFNWLLIRLYLSYITLFVLRVYQNLFTLIVRQLIIIINYSINVIKMLLIVTACANCTLTRFYCLFPVTETPSVLLLFSIIEPVFFQKLIFYLSRPRNYSAILIKVWLSRT